MKIFSLVLCLLMPGFSVLAQNIVPNGNFSLHVSCPAYIDDILACQGWQAPTIGTTDYYNACYTAIPGVPAVGVPYNFVGYQSANDSAYAGIITYADDSLGSDADYKEYLFTTIPALQPGATYKVTISVSLADSVGYAVDGLGVFFSSFLAGLPIFIPTGLSYTPQVNYDSFGVITEKVNWVTLTKNFIADSAFTQITIGNFKFRDSCNVVPNPAHGSGSPAHMSYYYIDSVAVEKIALPLRISNVITDPSVYVYPNPVTDVSAIHFNYIAAQSYLLNIYDIRGKLISRIDQITTNEVKIIRRDLQEGFYFYQLLQNNDVISSGRFIVK